MNQDLSDTEDYEATSEILSGSTVFEDTSESIAYASTKVLPPIERSEIAVQTDITLVSGSNVSSFRPEQLTQEIPPYPPLPIIATTSAPALLKGVEETAENRTSDEEDGSKVSVNDLHTQINNINNDSADQLQTMDEDAQSDVPTQPSEGGSNSTYTSISELDGVGPPTILQYIKESTKVKRNVPAPRPLLDRFPTVDPGCERGNMCPFCHTELLPVPPLSDASDDETETPTPNDMRKPGSPPYTIKDTERGTPGLAKAGAQSVFSVKSPPPMFGLPEDNDDDKLRSDGYLYCCEDYYWHLVNKNRIERRDSFYQEGEVMEVKKIDVSPHAPFGSKAARKLAKDRATERVRERELDKVRPPGGPPRAGGGGGGGATTLFSYARQMKTINFALSSRKCLEDGWTVTNYVPPPETPEPVLYDSMDTTQFHPLPGLAIPWQQTSSEFNKYYRNGTLFLTLLPDGTGTCYYPSGAPAVVIALEQPGIYCYYLLSDSTDTAVRLLAVCSQIGRCTVFHPNDSIHYQCTPLEGSLFNDQEVRTKTWQWDAFTPHVHAPPFQPVYIKISPFFSLRCVSLEQQTLVFNYKRYTFKCSVGSRAKKLIAKPLECQQLIQYHTDLRETREKINENLRRLNNYISSAHVVTPKEKVTDVSRLSPAPRHSAGSTRMTLAAR